MRHTLTVILLLAAAALPLCAAPSPERRVHLGRLLPSSARQGWGSLQVDRSVQGKQLKIGDREFERGLGTHAESELVYDLEEPYERFEAWVGVDAEMAGYKESSVIFQLFVDGRQAFDSGVMRLETPAKQVSVPLAGASELRLVVTDAGDGINCDHADWADAALVGSGAPAAQAPGPVRYTVRAAGLSLGLTERGQIGEVSLGRSRRMRRPTPGETHLGGCRPTGPTQLRRLEGGGLEFRTPLRHAALGRRCTTVERFLPAGDSIRWEVEISGEGEPWSVPISTLLKWPSATKARFWTAWSDPEQKSEGWRDPLVLMPFRDLVLSYGNVGSNVPTHGDYFCLPIATLAEPAADAGLSLVLSPEDTLLDLTLVTGADGTIRFARRNYRLGGGRTVRFTMDLVPHEADWRGGLRWMAKRYPAFFDPPNPDAGDVAGCGAYSTHEGELDAAKLKRMAFGVNWKASFDFPYMGMFLPPVPGDSDEWPRFDADSGGSRLAGQATRTSVRQLADYSRRMRAMGFQVLNYFNVTEFGAGIGTPEQARQGLPDAEVWRNATDFLYTRIPDGVLYSETGQRYGTWGGAVAMDPGGKEYQAFLLAQARRHVEKLPDSAGICIDRMDWLRLYNPRADDGVSWRNGKAARALVLSWRELMAKLGPVFHNAGKVIFANVMLKRLELMRELDGIYCEFGHTGPALNASALLGIHKPVLAWTPSAGTLKPDPDAYFQRHLYLGAFPTAPFPGNDHTINPDPWAEKYYLEYGPLLDLLRGRKWVLVPHAVAVGGNTAKANLFRTSVGFVVPVVFGDKAGRAKVTVQGLAVPKAGLTAQAYHPGEANPVSIRPARRGSVLILDVPLQRGCAMVALRAAPKAAASRGQSQPRQGQ